MAIFETSSSLDTNTRYKSVILHESWSTIQNWNLSSPPFPSQKIYRPKPLQRRESLSTGNLLTNRTINLRLYTSASKDTINSTNLSSLLLTRRLTYAAPTIPNRRDNYSQFSYQHATQVGKIFPQSMTSIPIRARAGQKVLFYTTQSSS